VSGSTDVQDLLSSLDAQSTPESTDGTIQAIGAVIVSRHGRKGRDNRQKLTKRGSHREEHRKKCAQKSHEKQEVLFGERGEK
jgi:hypothetical protein